MPLPGVLGSILMGSASAAGILAGGAAKAAYVGSGASLAGGAIGGGGSTNIQITGNVMSDDFVEQELADKLIEATRRGNTFA